tara:strand:- start:18680 stop:18817 length:138 start_codon:yes stop_codon:yes gene_type:complete
MAKSALVVREDGVTFTDLHQLLNTLIRLTINRSLGADQKMVRVGK